MTRTKMIMSLAFGLMILCSASCRTIVNEDKASYRTFSSEDNVIAANFPAQTDPDTSRFDNGYGALGMDAVPEHDYSNITAFAENEEYPLDFEKINITIKNGNAGKAFWFYTIPVVEYCDNGEWKRLNYCPEGYNNIEEVWALCLIEGDPGRQFSTGMTIFENMLDGEWKSGEYRAVIFVGQEKIYAPFRLINRS